MVHRQSVWSLLLSAAALVLASGCAKNPEAVFKTREATRNLIPDARKAVLETLKEGFGTPHDLVAWERLPVEFGGVQGTVQLPSNGAEVALTQLVMQWDGPADGVSRGSPVVFIAGKRAASKDPVAVVESFDPKTGVLSLSAGKGESVSAGDRLAVGFGRQLQMGRTVYMKNCNHCHGVAGDGEGPTARFLNPRPRDYRLGLFKFTSTLPSEKIARDDLHRIVQYGIPGTYMPSFLLLGDKETTAVIEYVRWLAMRGEFEKRVDDELSDYTLTGIDDDYKKAQTAYAAARKNGEQPEKPESRGALTKKRTEEFKTYLADEFPGAVDNTANFIADGWTRAEDPASVITPSVARVADDAASRERGRLMYLSDKTKCYTCHGVTGRGNGGATEDFWKKPGSNDTYPKRGLHDVWGNLLAPRDLTRGQYRGGRRPVDLFRRLYAGIKGTPMPAFGGTVLKDHEIWDLVNYVMSIPYEPATPPSSGKPAEAQMADNSKLEMSNSQ